MKQSKFERFRELRRAELRHAMTMLWVMQRTMPPQRYYDLMTEMKSEFDELSNDKIIYFHHVKLLSEDVKYK